MSDIFSIDFFFTKFLNNLFPHTPLYDLIFSFFSIKGANIVIWIFIIILLIILEERKNPGISKRDKKFIIIFLSAFLTTSVLVEFPLKNFFQRPRPNPTSFNQFQPATSNSNCPSNFSFPSGHTATAFAAATVLAYFDKKRRFFYYSIATLVAYSRIYLGCHYFFDVIGGGMVGFVIARLLIKLMSERN
jgi:undecaprenyl-diphosphatase